ncbi:hypothetical protein B296_00057407 [Ensete ventricosum]|uniref:Uncharacterized protein n=1 Tax=Ensete ventricosum TaxID=4639 RepID=A0A426XR64_ENSVE|nr:hypothetical protein B296_00057407 [Ensete ventricosum]
MRLATRKGAVDCDHATEAEAPPARAVACRQKGNRPWLACGRGYRRWAAARGQAIEVIARRGDACGQKLPPTRVATRTNVRRGGASHGRDADPAPWQRGRRRARQSSPT